ncbi:MAG TPA: hypothetical protein VN048_00250 [Verrucomicrobiae bacterium]|jgi:hypothetical protein|nr:hypothetical protein [Verrucomicrobiae bacterium]
MNKPHYATIQQGRLREIKPRRQGTTGTALHNRPTPGKNKHATR